MYYMFYNQCLMSTFIRYVQLPTTTNLEQLQMPQQFSDPCCHLHLSSIKMPIQSTAIINLLFEGPKHLLPYFVTIAFSKTFVAYGLFSKYCKHHTAVLTNPLTIPLKTFPTLYATNISLPHSQ